MDVVVIEHFNVNLDVAIGQGEIAKFLDDFFTVSHNKSRHRNIIVQIFNHSGGKFFA